VKVADHAGCCSNALWQPCVCGEVLAGLCGAMPCIFSVCGFAADSRNRSRPATSAATPTATARCRPAPGIQQGELLQLHQRCPHAAACRASAELFRYQPQVAAAAFLDLWSFLMHVPGAQDTDGLRPELLLLLLLPLLLLLCLIYWSAFARACFLRLVVAMHLAEQQQLLVPGQDSSSSSSSRPQQHTCCGPLQTSCSNLIGLGSSSQRCR